LQGKPISGTAARDFETLRIAREDETLYEYLKPPLPVSRQCICTRCHVRVNEKSAVQVECKCIVQIMHVECAHEYTQAFKHDCAMCLGKIHTVAALAT